MSELEEPKDPRAPDTDELLTLLLLQSMRTYDVMMAILMHTDPANAEKLFELHKSHETWGPLPFIEEKE